jgi:hypothetical protein
LKSPTEREKKIPLKVVVVKNGDKPVDDRLLVSLPASHLDVASVFSARIDGVGPHSVEILGMFLLEGVLKKEVQRRH